MAKLGFKDILMKYLKKDETFQVKYVDPQNKKNFNITYRSKGEAEAKAAQLRKNFKGYGQSAVKSIQVTQEDAPANATGTAVAGTGDDSSTVVVKKKKELQKKLMTRMGITETINRTIPDLEYPKDEIRERADQLKELASKSEVNTDTYADSKKKMLGKSEDLDAQPQDKDVKKVKGTQPKKYYKKLDKDTKKKRAAFFKKKAGTYKKSDDDDDYKAAPGDEKAKTKKSTFTKKFKQMYGDNYGYTAMHSKPVAKLNPLRRKDESK